MTMEWYLLFAWIAFCFCLVGVVWHLFRLLMAAKNHDYAPPSGKPGPAITYAFTGAMSPAKKESAFLHLPTYTAGILYHIGTFLAILIFILALAGVHLPARMAWIFAAIFAVSFGCGIGILVKRMVKPGLRALSNPDDYLSNLLVTVFHLMTALMLVIPGLEPIYFLSAGAVCFLFPFSKLKHAVYFFAARYQLGLFFGRRGVWPPRKLVKNSTWHH